MSIIHNAIVGTGATTADIDKAMSVYMGANKKTLANWTW